MSEATESARLFVAQYLYDRLGEWVPGYELTTEDGGGSEGLRRLRELRAKPYEFRIEKRKMKGSRAFEYRMLGG